MRAVRGVPSAMLDRAPRLTAPEALVNRSAEAVVDHALFKVIEHLFRCLNAVGLQTLNGGPLARAGSTLLFEHALVVVSSFYFALNDVEEDRSRRDAILS